MDGLSRRAFCTLMGASAGALAGCASLGDVSPLGGGGTVNVSTRVELERAFENLSPGETILISANNAPYRTTEWLDIDTDGVTVIGSGLPNLVTPADGAAVGGIRIGHQNRCQNVTVRGFGFDGNPAGRRNGAARLHGITVADASNVTLENNHVRRTHPTRHGDGGSGISVNHPCTNVVIRNNRIEEFGDRGVQAAGTGVLVDGNVITDGLDRPVACDVWERDGENYSAERMVVRGNMLGNSVEGSLVGIAGNTRKDPSFFVSIVGNVGFGAHKSFCHLRGTGKLSNVTVRHNVSRQKAAGLRTDVRTFSGVTVDPKRARDVTVANNAFWGYRGHGVRVSGDAAGVVVRDNRLSNPGGAGVRLEGVRDSVVAGNAITGPGGSGIRLVGAANVAVRGNFVRGAGGGAVVESADAASNWVAGNWADGDDPWYLASATTRARGNEPPTGVFRGVEAGENGIASVRFARAYGRHPRLSFGRRAGGIEGVTYETNAAGNVVGAAIEVANADRPLDVFVD